MEKGKYLSHRDSDFDCFVLQPVAGLYTVSYAGSYDAEEVLLKYFFL
jgi:hypothetical protein